ncbi:hypothetical protein ABZ468_36875 [Streptomyces sp. NPDC005708]|uniref:hypothetical protein n=1 Tax=Streptomyces sp. NPDC005708 TaxID=3154564 RepID=UPI0033CD8430
MEQIIEAKREHRAPPEAPEPEAEPGRVLDLMAALNESVARAKASLDEVGEAEVHGMPQKKSGHPRCPGFLLPFGYRHSLLGSSCSRQGVERSLRSAYPVHEATRA